MAQGVFLCILEENDKGEQAFCTERKHEASGSTCWDNQWKCSPSPAGPEMDSSLWSRLPQEIVESLPRWGERLPAYCQARLQLVCKKWRSVLTCPDFLYRSWSCLSLGPGPLIAWDTSKRQQSSKFLQRWKNLKVQVPCDSWTHLDDWFEAHTVLGDRDGRDAEDRKKYGGYFEAWENGFLCMWYKSVFPHRLHICVVNPFNETWKELPYLATPSHLIRIIVVPAKGSGFRVMVRPIITCGGPDETESACENCRYYGFNVYNSESGAWSQMTREEYNPPPYDGPECSSSISVKCQSHLFHNGLLYVVLDDPGDLLVLNAEDGSFVRRLQGLGDSGVHGWATKGDIRILFEVLVEADGDIYCVASSKNECSVWKLDESLPRWIDVSAFNWSGPAGQDQVRLELVSTVVLGHRIYASIRARLWDPQDLSDARAFVLSYDISHGTWKLINCNVPSVLFAPRPDLHLSHQLPKVC